MPSNPLERLTRSFTVRLSMGYAALFTFSAAILVGLLYFLLASALQRKDQEIIEARLTECAAVYSSGGLAALQYLVQRSRDSAKEKSFFVRCRTRLAPSYLLRRRTIGIKRIPRRWTKMRVSPSGGGW